MKTNFLVLALLISLSATTGYSQEKNRKQEKEESRIDREIQVEKMLDAKSFIFIATVAFPSQVYNSVQLASSSNYLEFRPDRIESFMPFYGNAYSGVGFDGDPGIKFKGKPEKFSVKKGKNKYIIKVIVNGEHDIYKLSLSVKFDGDSYLTVTSTNRSSISYNGAISAIE